MKYYLFILFFIFLSCCSKNNIVNKNNIDKIPLVFSKDYSFKEYTNILIKNNEFKLIPDVNNFPE